MHGNILAAILVCFVLGQDDTCEESPVGYELNAYSVLQHRASHSRMDSRMARSDASHLHYRANSEKETSGLTMTSLLKLSTLSSSIGGTVSLDESGYAEVARTCCNAAMFVFAHRVVKDELGFELCRVAGLAELVPWFTCSHAGHWPGAGEYYTGSFAQLKEGLLANTPPATCAFVAEYGKCQSKQQEFCNKTVEADLYPNCAGDAAPPALGIDGHDDSINIYVDGDITIQVPSLQGSTMNVTSAFDTPLSDSSTTILNASTKELGANSDSDVTSTAVPVTNTSASAPSITRSNTSSTTDMQTSVSISVTAPVSLSTSSSSADVASTSQNPISDSSTNISTTSGTLAPNDFESTLPISVTTATTTVTLGSTTAENTSRVSTTVSVAASGFNRDSCPDGQTDLEDYDECLLWAVRFGKTSPKTSPASIASTTDDDRPSGCIHLYVPGLEDRYIWNEPTTPGRAARDCAPVCKSTSEDAFDVSGVS